MKKTNTQYLFALLWFSKPQPGLGLHWLRAVKTSMQTVSALKSLQTSTGSGKGYKHQVPKQ